MTRGEREAQRLRDLTDEELIADAIDVRLTGRPVLTEFAHDMLDTAIADFRRPEFRAGFGASVLTTALLARARMPGVVAIVLGVMVGASVEHLYGMALDVHEKLTDAPGEV